ncbi:hypothetical protein NLJ89_g7436 [Agrocybe chaxingu]|uniref:Uncharacterized protein n=1 Tax=Agrocybe chaxingu TaxID=84603 RepID=A0A9W8JWU0_9AGAR|nr:hypothetical protein NLJ89_g7436 [Agrocybe chaxingu]
MRHLRPKPICSTHSEPTPAPAPPARQPSPPPPPKVKMSLRDFAARRKKQKEEAELSKSIQASPMSVASALGATPSPMIPNVVLADEVKDKEKSTLEKEKGVLEKEEVKEVVKVASAVIGVVTKAEERVVAVEKQDEVKVTTVFEVAKKDDRPVLGGLKEARNGLNVPAMTPSTTKPVTNGPLSTFEPSTFDSVASFMPSSPIGPHIPMPHINGHSSISRSPSETFLHSPSTRGFASSPSAIGSPLIDTHKTKQELVEHHIPPLSTSPAPPYLSSALLRRSSINDRSISPISPDPGLSSSSLFLTRVPHEEDGEIGEASPPISRHPLPSKRDFSFPPRSSIPAWMKSHTPPTGPRSSNGASTSPTPPFPRPAFASAQPPSSNSLPPVPHPPNPSAPPSNTNIANNSNRPLPPSAPRAFVNRWRRIGLQSALPLIRPRRPTCRMGPIRTGNETRGIFLEDPCLIVTTEIGIGTIVRIVVRREEEDGVDNLFFDVSIYFAGQLFHDLSPFPSSFCPSLRAGICSLRDLAYFPVFLSFIKLSSLSLFLSVM